MSNLKEIIQRVDSLKPNGFEPNVKLRWISQLDGKIAADIMLMDISELQQFNYRYPEDLEAQPLARFPHDDVYEYWLEAQIDAANGEYNRYQNSMALFNESYANFLRWFANKYEPSQGPHNGCVRPGAVNYYITAYGLAVSLGYKGTLQEWVASLKGEKGDKGDKGDAGAKLEIGAVTTLPVGSAATASITGTAEKPVLNLGIPQSTDELLTLYGGTMRGAINMGGFSITNLQAPVNGADAATMSYADSVGMPYKGLLSKYDPEDPALAQGVYLIDSQSAIHGISEGLLFQRQIVPGKIVIQKIMDSTGALSWERVFWGDDWGTFRQRGFTYGEALPEDAQDGQLFLMKVQEG